MQYDEGISNFLNAMMLGDKTKLNDTVKDDFESIFDTKKPVEVLYNTNESEKIKKLSDEKVDDVDFSKDTINIISVAKIVPSKGYDRLMKIHKKLIEKNIKNLYSRNRRRKGKIRKVFDRK